MKRVYVVIAGYDYEGYSASSLKVFTSRVSAEAYAKEVTKGDWSFDHATVMAQEVIEDKEPEYDSAGFTEDDRIVDGQYMLDKDDIDPAGGRGLHSHI
jgi:hypothetical protein